jgi:hypothetical protein
VREVVRAGGGVENQVRPRKTAVSLRQTSSRTCRCSGAAIRGWCVESASSHVHRSSVGLMFMPCNRVPLSDSSTDTFTGSDGLDIVSVSLEVGYGHVEAPCSLASFEVDPRYPSRREVDLQSMCLSS